MNLRTCLLLFFAVTNALGVEVDGEAFLKSLNGSKALRGKATDYELSGASYRTYHPEVSPSPDGGLFVSVRIDHMRGFLASDDHASLEITVSPDGAIVAAQSSIALQGLTISSDLIKGTASASNTLSYPGVDRAVKIGTDLVADLSSKMLREKIVEPGRVTFPAAIRHNYNLLFQALKKAQDTVRPADAPKPVTAPEVKPFQQTPTPPVPAQPKK